LNFFRHERITWPNELDHTMPVPSNTAVNGLVYTERRYCCQSVSHPMTLVDELPDGQATIWCKIIPEKLTPPPE